MLEVNWNINTGWSNPRIIPYGDLALSPAASGLHYGLQCFEGLKAYTDANGKIRLFRPVCLCFALELAVFYFLPFPG